MKFMDSRLKLKFWIASNLGRELKELDAKELEDIIDDIVEDSKKEGIFLDWNRIPKDKKYFHGSFTSTPTLGGGYGIVVPRPEPTFRKRTREEKIHAIQSYLQTPNRKIWEAMTDEELDEFYLRTPNSSLMVEE